MTRESFLPFGSCQLCLLPARDPVACPSHGHLFCRECAISNLLAQNQELKRLKKQAAQRKVEDEEEKDIADAEASARDLEDFERLQAGLVNRKDAKPSARVLDRPSGKTADGEDNATASRGIKRKLGARDGESSASIEKVMERSTGHDGGNAELPSFWVPSKIPDHKKADVEVAKQQPSCPAAAADQIHDFSLKTLVTVKFHQDTARSDVDEAMIRTCPSCNKALTNTTKAIFAKPCGHVVCKPCSDKFQKPADPSAHDTEHDETVRCYVCQEDITPGKKVSRKKQDGKEGKKKEEKRGRGLVELSTEGTGFAGGGKNMVKKSGLSFQC